MLSEPLPVAGRRADWLALGAYLVAALVFLLPLPAHWLTHVPGNNGDSIINLWSFWYYPHALLKGDWSLLHSTLQLYPAGISLVYTSSSLPGAIAMAPVSVLLSPAAALNCWLLLHLTLGGWFFYRFCRVLGVGPWAGWLGGFVYAWSPFVAVHITGHYTLVQIGYTSAAMLYLALMIKKARVQPPGQSRFSRALPTLGLAAAVWAVAVTDFYLATMTLLLLLATVLHFALDRDYGKTLTRPSFLKPFGLAILLAGVMLLPWVVAIISARDGHDYAAINPVMGSNNVARWSRLMTIPAYHGVWEPMSFPQFMGKISLFNEWNYLGMVAFFLAAFGVLYVRPLRRALPWVLTFLLALGFAGGNHYTVQPAWPRGPLSFGKYWPTIFPFSEFRVPGRWHFVLIVSVAVGLALGMDALLGRLRRPGSRTTAALAATALLAFDLMRWPLPICPAAPLQSGIPPASARDGAVLDVPVGLISGQGHSFGRFSDYTLLRQMDHARPVLSANVSRLPNDVVAALQADPELAKFVAAQSDASTSSPSTLDWPAFRLRFGITSARIPLDWPTSITLRTLIDQTAPAQWQWQTRHGAIIGTIPAE